MPSSRSASASGRRLATLSILATVAALAVAACGGAGASPSPTAGAATGAAAAPTITGAWVRPPQGMDRPAGGYLVITGGATADALLSVKSAAAGSVEIHETTTDASGMSGMHPIARLDIPAGATVELKPGGYHLMFMDVTEGAIAVGKTVTIELTFEKAGTITVQAEVREG